ncbi:MAG: hypothetical protein HQ592_09470 [Planctomycetes bacterium]|nr:hypothetical protein [Planctomycetota bacterium]
MTKGKRTIFVVSVVALTCLGAAAEVRSRRPDGPHTAPWWNSAWKKRIKVSVDVIYGTQPKDNPWRKFDEHRGQQLTAVAEFYRKNAKQDPEQKDVRVVDAQGNELSKAAYYLPDSDTVMVRFPAPQDGGDFFIYFDNNNPPPVEEAEWFPKPGSPTLTTLKLAAVYNVDRLSQIKAVLRGNTTLHGKRPIRQAAMQHNPTGLRAGNNRYVTYIEGLINAEIAGEYKFAVSSGGLGYLMIAGKLVASNTTKAKVPPNIWLRTEWVTLKKGYHHFRLLLSEMADHQGVRLGWQPPGRKTMKVLPRKAFADYVRAVPREFSRFDGKEELYFTTIRSTVGIDLDGRKAIPAYHRAHLSRSGVQKMLTRKTVAPVELINLSTFDARNTRYQWKINGAVKSSARRVTVPVEIDRPTRESTHTITLEAYRGRKLLARKSRTCKTFTEDPLRPQFELETIGAPNIVFVGEKENLSFRIRSSMANAFLFDWDYVLRKPGGGSVLVRESGTVDTAASEEAIVSVPLDTSRYGRDAEIVITLSASGVPLASSLFRVMPLGQGVRSLKPQIASLVNGSGNRVIISTQPIDEDAHRKWVLLKWVRSATRRSNGNVFLYGSSMENAPCSGEEFVSYVSLVRRKSIKASKKLDFVERTTQSVCGILADVPKFATSLDARNADTIVICPGPWDALRGVPVRDFKRSLQLMLNMISATGTPTRTVLVSPPPLATNVNFSKLYRDATEELARQNRVKFVDIHNLLNSKDYLRYYRSNAGDAVHYTYPNNDGQEAIADAIWKAIE